jgi:ribulose-5-phosphate 4-epimerase/fuculose-1-phosphate aldolase
VVELVNGRSGFEERSKSAVSSAPIADPALLRELVIANRILAHEGVVDAFGHVSVRHPEDSGQYLISRSLGPELVTEADLQRFTLVGKQVGGNEKPAYAERAIHGAIYEARPEAMAVCHNHSPSVISFGVTGVPLKPIFHMGSLIGAEVPVWDVAEEFGDTDMLVKDMDQGRSLARTVGQRRVALMRGHGCVVVGKTLREVVMTSVYLEVNARLQLQAMSLGDVRYLSPGEVQRTMDTLLDSLSSQRAWSTWEARVTT